MKNTACDNRWMNRKEVKRKTRRMSETGKKYFFPLKMINGKKWEELIFNLLYHPNLTLQVLQVLYYCYSHWIKVDCSLFS